jgi:hypothetical protein
MESRKVEVGVLPEELRKVLISVMEGRPMFEGAGWCAAEGAWLEEMWCAEARPWICQFG